MSVYGGDDPAFLRGGVPLASSTTRPAAGRRGAGPGRSGSGTAAAMIDELVATVPVPARLLVLDANVGLGPALTGDDVLRARHRGPDGRRRHRGAATVRGPGAAHRGGRRPGGVRAAGVRGRRPRTSSAAVCRRSTPTQIVRYSRFHEPFNHPTVVYRAARCRRPAATDLAADGGLPAVRPDDPDGRPGGQRGEPLVLYRVGAGAYARRGGVALAQVGVGAPAAASVLGFTNTHPVRPQCRCSRRIRLVPERLRKRAYRRWIANRVRGEH